ncbi:CGNR zinc finger domain-containing protein [Streptomyces daqingensis]|uniref:CGNR zinc finger domain-containing protein n=1 Tax=Streptomyces daqingensis TaxID=1472640 RepID=UPI0016676DFD|nr:CGNR zinc finger domain-containing protein [Streptomyces daqingensis]
MTDRSAPKTLVLVQELVNTLDVETGEDSLTTPDGVAEFAERQDLRGLGLEETGDADLRAIRELRESLRAACLAHTGTDMPQEAAAKLARLLAAAPLVVTLDESGRPRLGPAGGLSGAAALTAEIAAGIATAEADGSWRRLKACEAHDCLWVFYDRSPAGRGRWCTMAVCGSRAKMRTYRAKRRA